MGAAIHDVETGIDYAKNTYLPGLGTTWNGKLAVVGNSAGGNLAYQALARWQTPEGTAQADAFGGVVGVAAVRSDHLAQARLHRDHELTHGTGDAARHGLVG